MKKVPRPIAVSFKLQVVHASLRRCCCRCRRRCVRGLLRKPGLLKAGVRKLAAVLLHGRAFAHAGTLLRGPSRHSRRHAGGGPAATAWCVNMAEPRLSRCAHHVLLDAVNLNGAMQGSGTAPGTAQNLGRLLQQSTTAAVRSADLFRQVRVETPLEKQELHAECDRDKFAVCQLLPKPVLDQVNGGKCAQSLAWQRKRTSHDLFWDLACLASLLGDRGPKIAKELVQALCNHRHKNQCLPGCTRGQNVICDILSVVMLVCASQTLHLVAAVLFGSARGARQVKIS